MEIPPVDAEEAALRELGHQTDLAEGRPVESEGAKTPEQPAPPAEAPQPPPQRPEVTPPDSEPEPTPPEPEPPPQKPAAQERDERGRFKEAPPPQAPPPKQPQKSPYAVAREKEQKEQIRKERSWKEIVAEKDRLRAEQAKWQEERRMEQLQRESQVPPLQKEGIDLQGYQKAYVDFRQRGDFENALRSLETVLELEQMGNQQIQQRQEAQYELAWRKDMEVTLKNVVDLNDPNSQLAIETDRIINEHPYLFYIPQGFQKAVEIATLLLAAGSDSELREENERLRAQLEEYQHSSQPARGGPGKPPRGQPTRQEDMTLDEEEAHLRDLTRREDSFAGR